MRFPVEESVVAMDDDAQRTDDDAPENGRRGYAE